MVVEDIDESVEMKKDKFAVRQTEKKGRLRDYSAILAAAVVILGGVHCARGVLGPFFLATFFTVLLISPINWLKNKGWSSGIALMFVVTGVALVGLVTMTIVGSQLALFGRNLPEYRVKFATQINGAFNIDIGNVFPFLKADEEDEPKKIEEQTEVATDQRTLQREKSLARFDDSNKVAIVNVKDVRRQRNDVQTETIRNAAYLSAVASPSVVESNASESDFEPDANADTTFVAAQESDLGGRGLTPIDPPALFMSNGGDSLSFSPSTMSTGLVGEKEADDLDFFDSILTLDEGKEEASKEETENKPIVSNAGVVAESSQNQLFEFLRGLAGELSYVGSNAFLVTLLVIFMLCETAKIPKKLVAALGKRRFTNTHIDKVLADIRNYMVIKTMMSVTVGVLVLTLCLFANVQYSVLWGFVAFLLNYIPNIGSVVAAIPPIVLATIDHGVFVGGLVSLFLALINCGVGYVLEPRLLGEGLDLSPLIVLISLIFFGWLLGPVGMFISPPLAVVMKIIFQSFPETQWIAALMAKDPPPVVREETAV